MKVQSLSAVLAGLFFLPGAVAHPDMEAVLEQLKAQDCCDSTELLGDLLYLHPTDLTPVGRLIEGILTGTTGGESDEPNNSVPELGSAACHADTCCVWQYVVEDIKKYFKDYDGQCTNAARAAIRLGFHDAAGWSKHTGEFGGADGSVVLAPEEAQRRPNAGLQQIIAQMKIWHDKWSSFGISMADLIQVAANTATVACPLGPRIRTFVGRKDSHIASPEEGLLPSPFDEPDFLIELFRAKTIQPRGLAALLGAHSTSRQRFIDATRFGAPQDSTPGIWDVLFYNQTLGPTPNNVFVMESDKKLAKHPRIHEIWRTFARDQARWNADYAREYVRVSLLGVYNLNYLTDCTRVLPRAVRYW
ncbi:putative lip/Mn/Versatile peroxidase [Rhypophila sp. PSN 637]